jgi:transcriptional regulator with XRE-family HTH domain
MENSESKPLGRTVPIRGDVVRMLRIQKGWSAADLCRRVGCSQRTIDNVEASKNVIAKTLAEIAEALGVEIRTLIDGPAGLPHPSQGAEADKVAEPPRIDVRIHITQLDDDKDGTKRLPGIMRDIQSAVGTQDEVAVSAVDVTDKINIRISICPHELVRFVGFFCAGRLDYHTFESMDFRPNALLEPLLKALTPERSGGGLSSRVGRAESSVEAGSGTGRTEEGPVAIHSRYGHVSTSDEGHAAGHYSSIMIKYRREHRRPNRFVDTMLDTDEILTAITRSREYGMFRSCVSSDGVVTID